MGSACCPGLSQHCYVTKTAAPAVYDIHVLTATAYRHALQFAVAWPITALLCGQALRAAAGSSKHRTGSINRAKTSLHNSSSSSGCWQHRWDVPWLTPDLQSPDVDVQQQRTLLFTVLLLLLASDSNRPAFPTPLLQLLNLA